jgi:hypothetical protein
MNGGFLRWLLDLDMIPAGSEGLRLTWERPWPPWVWALLVLLAAALAIWSYSRMSGSRIGRSALGVVRFLILLLVLVVISGPMIELPRETVEQDWVVMLVDRSASLGIKDVDDGDARVSRDEELRSMLNEHQPLWAQLADRRHVLWLGFDVGAFSLPESVSGDAAMPADIGAADGRRSRLSGSLDQALQRAAARSVSGIVVFSDGRTDDPPTRALVRRLQAEAIPVFVVPLGSPDPLGDLAIRRIDAPLRAFVRDKVPVAVDIDRLGSATQDIPSAAVLRDQLTGEELDRIELAPGDQRETVTLTAEPQIPGETAWEVVLETGRPDLIPENNARALSIELIDRPLQVLFIEGYPRWEYRYLKNLLVRERTIESSVMLISADRDFAQEGNMPITRLPRSPEEFARFDVIVIGDVPATFFSPEQLEMIRDQVATRGTGLLFIGGDRWLPRSYTGTALADVLPMRGSLELRQIGEAVTVSPTPLAARLGVMRLSESEEDGWPDALSDPSYGWSRLYWAQRIEPGQLKPAAEVLAYTADEHRDVQLPLVTQMRYGAGQSIYVATDEIWRWRYGRGEKLTERFWVQLIRMLARESLTAAGAVAVLDATPNRVELNQPVRLSLQVLDAQTAQSLPAAVTAVVKTEDGKTLAEIELQPEVGAETRYAATYLPDVEGRLRVHLDDPSFEAGRVETSIEVHAHDDELRRPETDHEILATLASTTSGRVLDANQIQTLPGILPNREVRTINPLSERIWDTPLVFVLLLVLLVVEWVGRKIIRLV